MMQGSSARGIASGVRAGCLRDAAVSVSDMAARYGITHIEIVSRGDAIRKGVSEEAGGTKGRGGRCQG